MNVIFNKTVTKINYLHLYNTKQLFFDTNQEKY